MAASNYQQTYNSFSGVDMQVMAGSHLLAEIQGLSFTVTREKAPLYTMGSADPRSFSRGKRGIAGSMIFLVFDRSALLQSMKGDSFYLANQYELTNTQNTVASGGSASVNRLTSDGATTAVQATTGTPGVGDRTNITGDKVIASVRYHDQILPFNIVLEAANEYGHMAKMEITNVEIMNCGSGMSIDDITTDESCTFVATGLVPWYRQAYINPRTQETLRPLSPPQGRAGGGT